MSVAELAARLPSIPDLIRITKAIATLDAILCEDWEFRYYSFNAHWDESDPAQMMASMRNGSGDQYFIWFSSVGAAIKGFAHEAPLSPFNHDGTPYPGVLDGVPETFESFLNEPAFVMDNVTFCFWRAKDDSRWQAGDVVYPADAGDDPDGAGELLAILDGRPSTYVEYARDYFEVDVSEGDVRHVYELGALSEDLIERLGSERTLAELREDLAEIGYP